MTWHQTALAPRRVITAVPVRLPSTRDLALDAASIAGAALTIVLLEFLFPTPTGA